MQEWIIAMLVISVLLILRDMAKTIFSEMKKSAAALAYDQYPQKEKMQRYAESFQKLANSFYETPYRKEYLSSQELEFMVEEVQQELCRRCHLNQVCWKQHSIQSYQRIYDLLRIMEEQDEEALRKARADLTGICVNQGKLMQELQRLMERERQNLIWNNKLLENRMAVAEQLQEVAQLMKTLSRDLFDFVEVDRQFREEVEKALKKKQIQVGNLWVLEQPDGRIRYYAELRTTGGGCISATEAAQVLSKFSGTRMIPKIEGKTLIGKEYSLMGFGEAVNFKMLYGAAKMTKDKETISGDNYTCTTEENGQFFMCLSDGMGSGLEACKESESIVDTLEQLVEAGFSGETAARMVNSVLNLRNRNGRFSTVDISMVDLYSGVCHFLKAGAATTFIKRDHWVEAISSTSLALGLVQQADFQTAAKKLYEGDFLIMVTDGVLDALPSECAEETMKEIILQTNVSAAQELGRGILERVLTYSGYKAEDDMTILTAGLWRN
ncbi:MAG: SpoIIE family protein phosphatase [Blautia sp.]|uniref:SpoIIE family protein phosphatase n=1 Tax=Blautia sp. TaxID=1955243 RepID=UPI0024277D61|nr:SpoIIE family protein phosphatase [Blautia sp.]MBS6160861.1 SpoIIE family protein phosphatase [Bacillota bacterium]MEE1444057.1 SpoIIE family protein phosphatase [Blautia sp.]